MGTVTKRDLVEDISKSTNIPRAQVRKTVQEFLDQVVEHLYKGNRLELRDFGVFEVKARKGRTAQNPKTLEPVQVPPRKTVRFRVGRHVRENLVGTEVLVPVATKVSR